MNTSENVTSLGLFCRFCRTFRAEVSDPGNPHHKQNWALPTVVLVAQLQGLVCEGGRCFLGMSCPMAKNWDREPTCQLQWWNLQPESIGNKFSKCKTHSWPWELFCQDQCFHHCVKRRFSSCRAFSSRLGTWLQEGMGTECGIVPKHWSACHNRSSQVFSSQGMVQRVHLYCHPSSQISVGCRRIHINMKLLFFRDLAVPRAAFLFNM